MQLANGDQARKPCNKESCAQSGSGNGQSPPAASGSQAGCRDRVIHLRPMGMAGTAAGVVVRHEVTISRPWKRRNIPRATDPGRIPRAAKAQGSSCRSSAAGGGKHWALRATSSGDGLSPMKGLSSPCPSGDGASLFEVWVVPNQAAV